MPSEVLPDDFFDDNRTNDDVSSTKSELYEARDLAEENPGKWVRVGDVRPLWKDMSAWVSEVNTGKKAAFQNREGTTEACWWREGDQLPDGRRMYGKAIRFDPYGEDA